MIVVRRLVEGEVVREAVFSSGELLVLGRSAQADFPLADGTVSRVHARLWRDESGSLWLEDAGSQNGIVVGASGWSGRGSLPRGRCAASCARSISR